MKNNPDTITHEDIVNRIKAKAEQQGIDDIFADAKRYETHFASIELAVIAERLGVSVHWVITGERDPYEVKIVHCTGSYPFDDEGEE